MQIIVPILWNPPFLHFSDFLCTFKPDIWIFGMFFFTSLELFVREIKWCVSCHKSHVTCHMSPSTYHLCQQPQTFPCWVPIIHSRLVQIPKKNLINHGKKKVVKIVVTFEQTMQFWCPYRFRIPRTIHTHSIYEERYKKNGPEGRVGENWQCCNPHLNMTIYFEPISEFQTFDIWNNHRRRSNTVCIKALAKPGLAINSKW